MFEVVGLDGVGVLLDGMGLAVLLGDGEEFRGVGLGCKLPSRWAS